MERKLENLQEFVRSRLESEQTATRQGMLVSPKYMTANHGPGGIRRLQATA